LDLGGSFAVVLLFYPKEVLLAINTDLVNPNLMSSLYFMGKVDQLL